MYRSFHDWKVEQDMLDKATEALEFFLASKQPVYPWHIAEKNALDRAMNIRHPHRRGGVLVGVR